MAKALIAVVLCTLLVAGLAADTGRNLLQKFDCDGAKELSKTNNACKLLCDCAAGLGKGKVSQKQFDEDTKRCPSDCDKCKSAAEKCKKGDGLPSACSEGTSNQFVQQCINTFLKSRSG